MDKNLGKIGITRHQSKEQKENQRCDCKNKHPQPPKHPENLLRQRDQDKKTRTQTQTENIDRLQQTLDTRKTLGKKVRPPNPRPRRDTHTRPTNKKIQHW